MALQRGLQKASKLLAAEIKVRMSKGGEEGKRTQTSEKLAWGQV